MSALNPEKLFATIAADIPSSLQSHLYVTGSLAAAYAFQRKLRGNAVNTKDADLVVHPAGHTASCREIASKLMALGWQPIEGCFPQPDAAPAHELRAIRLQPPTSTDYFLELLNVPSQDQTEPKIWIPVELADGWYGLPSFRFMGLTAYERQVSKTGLEYAAPAMMALSNALSHPEIGADRIQQGDLAGVLRSSKDLGRVLSLAHLAARPGPRDAGRTALPCGDDPGGHAVPSGVAAVGTHERVASGCGLTLQRRSFALYGARSDDT